MKIGFLGLTEKRPFLYTTLKILQGLGDSVLFVTTNLQYARLIMDEDYELEDIDGVFKAGAFQNTTIIVTSLTMDDLGPNGLNVINPDEFQHCIYDNQVGAEVDYTLFIKGLEENGEPSANKLKALVIKFLNTNLYINFPDLYKPKEYEDLIEELLDLPSRFKNYYLNVIDEVEIMNPDSPLIPKLKELGNSFLLMDAGSSTELRTVSQQERDLITRHRKALKKLISPDIVYLRERLNLPHTTYVYSISKVINELSTRLEEDELMSRFSKIILS